MKRTRLIIITAILILITMRYLGVSAFAAYYEPDPDPSVSYTITQRTDGDMDITFGGSTFRIVSNFSLPNTGTPWTKVGQDNYYYTVTRELVQYGDAIWVKDTFVNKRTANIPIIMRHSVTIAGLDALSWICGNDVGGNGENTQDWENPTVYGTVGNIGLGFMAYDDVFQVHSDLWRMGNQLGLEDNQFVLRSGVGTTHTAWWVIIPTKTADYWAFVNAARRFRNANFTIDGGLASLGFGYNQGIHRMTDAQLLQFLRYKDVKYISAGLMNPPYKGSLGIEHTSGYIPEHPVWDPTWTHDDARTQAQRIRNIAAANGLLIPKVLGYWHSQLEWDADLRPTYMSSPNNATILDQSGNPVWYDSERIAFMPTLTGQGSLWGTNIAACYTHMIDSLPVGVGYDGIFVDETEGTSPGGMKLYHWGPESGALPPDPWDGCSAEIDPVTHILTRYKANVNLVTLPYRLAKMQDMTWRNGFVWGNGSPCTASMINIKSYRLVETQSMWQGPRLAVLYMPVGLGSLYDTTPDACYIGMKDLLDRGCLYAWYYDGLSGIPTHHYPTQYMYPFTPIELHSGYVFGVERILTKNNGFFGFGDNTSTATVHVFDDTGTECASWTNYITYNGHRYWDLSTTAQLPVGGYACIVKNSSAQISGKISLRDYSGDLTKVDIRVGLMQNGSELWNTTVNLDKNGIFTIPDIMPGNYDLSFKGSHWLSKIVSGVNIE